MYLNTLRSQRQSLDANLEPNKQKISLGCLNDLMEKTDEFLKIKYKEGDDKQKETDTEQFGLGVWSDLHVVQAGNIHPDG